jgi:ubiquinone/menaquinone biosynthesis C-methylase UbiE
LATADRLPDYAPMLADYHRAFADELRAMVAALPVREGDRVLDVACGDGSYTGWLAERVGPRGRVTAIDASGAFLALARDAAEGGPVGLVAGSVERMPFADDSFDLVWCAQSLYSLPDPVSAVRAMRRVARPGGVVAVLENDTLHHLLLPWPVEVELAVRHAELVGFAEESDRPRKYYIGRRLGEVFREAGLVDLRTSTRATNREAPLGPAERAFLRKYLDDLRGRTTPHLQSGLRERFERLVDPGSDGYLLDRPGLTVTCIDHVVTGRKPAP